MIICSTIFNIAKNTLPPIALLIVIAMTAGGCSIWQQQPYPQQIDASQRTYGTQDAANQPSNNQSAQPEQMPALDESIDQYQANPNATLQASQQQPRPNQHQTQQPYQQNNVTPPQQTARTPRVTNISVAAVHRTEQLVATAPPAPPATPQQYAGPYQNQPSQNYQQPAVSPEAQTSRSNITAVSLPRQNSSRPNNQPDFSPHATSPSAAAAPQYVQPVIITNQQADPRDSSYSFDRTVTALQQLIANDPENTEAQIALRLLYSVYGQQEQVLGEIPDLAPENQARSRQIADAMLLAARAASQQGQSNPQIANQALQALQQLTDRVSQNADLEITNVQLCSRVSGFGQYEAIPQATLGSGSPLHVWVYFELQNFTSQTTDDGRYITRLRGTITFYDSNFDVIAQRSDNVTDSPSFTPRRDFYLRGDLNLPALAPGRYQVVVRIEDLVGEKIDDARIEFEVTGS